MRYKVPKFLERETKIVSFLTFKQLGVLGGVGVVLFILYYVVSLPVFVFCAIFIAALASAFMFVKIDGVPLWHLVTQSFSFFSSPRTYIWKKKEPTSPIKLVQKKEATKEKREAPPLRVAPESKLKKLSSKIDFGS